jgi:hypothetical protein
MFETMLVPLQIEVNFNTSKLTKSDHLVDEGFPLALVVIEVPHVLRQVCAGYLRLDVCLAHSDVDAVDFCLCLICLLHP